LEARAKKIVHETLSQKTHHRKGLAEWLKPKSVCLASVRP
jgi:hypothetical protein